MKTMYVVKNDVNKFLDNMHGDFRFQGMATFFNTDVEARQECDMLNLEIVGVTELDFKTFPVEQNQCWLQEIKMYDDNDFEEIVDGDTLTVQELIDVLSNLDPNAETDIYNIVRNNVDGNIYLQDN